MRIKKYEKKYIIDSIFTLFVCNLNAENLKIKIEGPERSYNQIRIINKTNNEDFECQIYKLKAEGDDFKVKRLLATYYLKENGDTDSCTFSIDRNTYIGISSPEDFENITYDIYYKDIPFFDIVDITLKEKSENTVETIEVG